MSKSIQASPPTFSVRTQPDGQVIKTRLTFEEANLVAVLFNRSRKDIGETDRRAELLREDDTVRWASAGPVPLTPRDVRRNSLEPI